MVAVTMYCYLPFTGTFSQWEYGNSHVDNCFCNNVVSNGLIISVFVRGLIFFSVYVHE